MKDLHCYNNCNSHRSIAPFELSHFQKDKLLCYFGLLSLFCICLFPLCRFVPFCFGFLVLRTAQLSNLTSAKNNQHCAGRFVPITARPIVREKSESSILTDCGAMFVPKCASQRMSVESTF